MGDKKSRSTSQHGGKKASQVVEVVQAILRQIRIELDGQFRTLHQRLSTLEQRVELQQSQSVLGRYREDARASMLELLRVYENSDVEISDEQTVKRAFDIADLMEAEYDRRIEARRAEIETRNAVAAATRADEEGLRDEDMQGLVDGIVDRYEGGDGPVVGGPDEDDDGSKSSI